MSDVTFTSSRFSIVPTGDAINYMCGRDLAEWLSAALAARGFDVGEVIAEDYGYGFWLKLHGAHYWLSHSQVETDDAMNGQPVWRVGVDYDPGCLWFWRLRARPEPGDKQEIVRAVHAVLEAAADIQHIEWS